MTVTVERYNPRAKGAALAKGLGRPPSPSSPRDDDPRDPYYVLEMFPYPSGRIHMGHVRNYAMGDVLARYMRTRGINVLHPWAGTPSGCRPKTPPCRTRCRRATGPTPTSPTCASSSRRSASAIDWTREFATCDVDYYHQQQKLFLDFLAAGPGHPQEIEGQLGSRRHDRARQRAGDRRPRLALRRRRRAARADAVVPEGLGLFRGAARGARWTRPVARKGPDHAAQLDRQVRGHAGCCSSSSRRRRRAPRRSIEVFTTRPDTIFGATLHRALARPSAGRGAGRQRTRAVKPNSSPPAIARAPRRKPWKRPKSWAFSPASG